MTKTECKATPLQHMILSTLADYREGCLGNVLKGTLEEYALEAPSASTVHTLIHRMQTRGWILTGVAGDDGRSKRYKITARGKRALAAAQNEAANLVRWFGSV